MTETSSRFCANCGRPLVAGAAFCAACGTRAVTPASAAIVPGVSAAAAVSAAQTPPGAPSFVSPVRTTAASATGAVQRTMSVASRGMAIGGMLAGTPWTAIVGGHADVGQLAKRWAPSLLSALPRPSLRVPALSLLFSVTLDAGAAVISGQPAAMQMAGLRALAGILTAVLGLLVGRRSGLLRYGTTAMSCVTSVIMLVSLGRVLLAAPANPAGWLPLIPTMICQVASVVCLVKTVRLTLKRHA